MNAILLIRADANLQIGTGHVMRCLALAQAWQDAGGQVVFAIAAESPSLEARLQTEGIEVTHLSAPPGSIDDAIQTMNLGRERSVDWILLDGYHFGTGYQRMVSSGPRLLVFDDYGHAEHYYADVVLNQNLYANENFYTNREPHTRLLLGTRYVLLRREFSKWRGWRREIPEVARKVLVTLGGSDPDNVTFHVIQALQGVKLDDLEVVVAVGGNNPNDEDLQSAIRGSRSSIRMEKNVTNMPEVMAWADMAVSAAGSTSWELAFMGLPAMILILAENQKKGAQLLAEKKVFLGLGYARDVEVQDIARVFTNLSLNRAMRQNLSGNGTSLVDGLGVHRVMQGLSEIGPKGREGRDCLARH
ncbi:MAG: UDP-2,4-diacetamido-2,4,6-trideoxy-beta-L-altropyranose hydrolase [Thermodesulfobacteriota bacterium]|jgi:UDP-2,4-diacetamido-2,4,6-trideoxy-beta-L-altropyranose hydrolase